MFRSEASGETFGLLAAKAGLLLSSLLEEEWLQLAQLKQGSSFSAPGGRCQVKENQQCENCLAFCRKRPERSDTYLSYKKGAQLQIDSQD